MRGIYHKVVVSASSTGYTSPWFSLEQNHPNVTVITKRDKKKFAFYVQRTLQDPDRMTPTVYDTDPVLNTTVASTVLAPDVTEISYTTPYAAIRYVVVSGNTSSDTTFEFTALSA